MSSEEINIDQSKNIKIDRKDNIFGLDLTNDFNLFIQEGNVFDIKKGSRPLEKFIPTSPEEGIDAGLGADNFLPSSRNTSKRLLDKFFGEQ